MKRFALVTLTAGLLAASAYAGDWVEQDSGGVIPGSFGFPDVHEAGNQLDSANITASTGPLNTITGVMNNGNDVDVYQITISDFTTFSVTTATMFGSMDPSLWLFDASGNAVKANIDQDAFSTLPMLDNSFVTSNGIYYLAVSARDGLSSGIYISPLNDSGEALFDVSNLTGQQGPLSPAGGITLGDPLTENPGPWTAGGFPSNFTSTYILTLTGVTPAPGGVTLIGASGLLLLRRRR